LGAVLREAYEEEETPELDAESSAAIEALEREQRQRRVLILKGALAVPLAALVAVGGAILLHMLAVGGFLAAWFFGPGHAAGGGDSAADAGTGGGGYVVVDSGPSGTAGVVGSKAADLLRTTSPPVMPTVPEPNLAQQLASAQLTPPPVPEPAVIGIRGAADPLGSLKIAPPVKPAPPVAVAPPPAIVVAPPPALPVKPAVAPPEKSTGGPLAMATGRGSTRAGSPVAGDGEGGGDEEPVIKIMGPGYKGLPNGNGGRTGSGIDRGPSGANNPSPQVLEQPTLRFPAAAALHPPTRRAVFSVEVLANGQVGTVTLDQSSGNSDVDEAARASILSSKFRPAYEAGKPITATMTMSFNPGLDDE
jgi:TonB family protein